MEEEFGAEPDPDADEALGDALGEGEMRDVLDALPLPFFLELDFFCTFDGEVSAVGDGAAAAGFLVLDAFLEFPAAVLLGLAAAVGAGLGSLDRVVGAMSDCACVSTSMQSGEERGWA